jgi:hypothetical protein
LFEDGRVKCYVCKTDLDSPVSTKQHIQSKLHKENANGHCIYRRPKVLKNEAEKIMYKVPEVKKTSYQKTFLGSSAKRTAIPKTIASRKTSTFSSPVYQPVIIDWKNSRQKWFRKKMLSW